MEYSTNSTSSFVLQQGQSAAKAETTTRPEFKQTKNRRRYAILWSSFKKTSSPSLIIHQVTTKKPRRRLGFPFLINIVLGDFNSPFTPQFWFRLKSSIKYSRQCFIGYPNTSIFVKNTPLRGIFNSFKVFGHPDLMFSTQEQQNKKIQQQGCGINGVGNKVLQKKCLPSGHDYRLTLHGKEVTILASEGIIISQPSTKG